MAVAMLSIDVGSSQTRLALMDKARSWPRHLEPLGEKSILSVLYHEPPANRYGRAALTRPARNCGRVLRDFPRILLADSMGKTSQDKYSSYTLKVEGSRSSYLVGQDEVSMEEVLQEFLTAVLAEVPSLTDEELKGIILPVPDALTTEARETCARAAQKAIDACGFTRRSELNEVAVTLVPCSLGPAILFAAQQEEKENVAPFIILDLGGGKLTCAAYEVVAGKIRLLATKTCPSLGGVDIENKSQLNFPFMDSATAKFKIRKAVGPAVRDLTVADMVEIESENIMGKDVSIELSKCQFMEITSDVAEQVVLHVKDLIGQIENFPDEGGRIILLGGSSRVPLIESSVERLWASASDEDVDNLEGRHESAVGKDQRKPGRILSSALQHILKETELNESQSSESLERAVHDGPLGEKGGSSSMTRFFSGLRKSSCTWISEIESFKYVTSPKMAPLRRDVNQVLENKLLDPFFKESLLRWEGDDPRGADRSCS
ncbi:HSP70-like protein [Guillardia theta CCMP2712]|uniref:HSP70-like protein n=1 Tax=Guillardia theta (strain CCMP2712) TaxID=905079 RepID=L1JY79_GUITC|nr:HSP70-like protein [Guillardia theta CCMP2712]EKX53536.1 HSP70-like protein [Guillardia theta CCMP2712]|eukprot:XP_005840516.1 HSP70-like protein [Guillardia theta CCMP2712]